MQVSSTLALVGVEKQSPLIGAQTNCRKMLGQYMLCGLTGLRQRSSELPSNSTFASGSIDNETAEVVSIVPQYPSKMRTSRLGSGRVMTLSKRPGRVRAVSSVAGRFVAAITTTPVLSSKPSISVSS